MCWSIRHFNSLLSDKVKKAVAVAPIDFIYQWQVVMERKRERTHDYTVSPHITQGQQHCGADSARGSLVFPETPTVAQNIQNRKLFYKPKIIVDTTNRLL